MRDGIVLSVFLSAGIINANECALVACLVDIVGCREYLYCELMKNLYVPWCKDRHVQSHNHLPVRCYPNQEHTLANFMRANNARNFVERAPRSSHVGAKCNANTLVCQIYHHTGRQTRLLGLDDQLYLLIFHIPSAWKCLWVGPKELLTMRSDLVSCSYLAYRSKNLSDVENKHTHKTLLTGLPSNSFNFTNLIQGNIITTKETTVSNKVPLQT